MHVHCGVPINASKFLQVVMRIRPMNSKESKAGAKTIVHPVDDKVWLEGTAVSKMK